MKYLYIVPLVLSLTAPLSAQSYETIKDFEGGLDSFLLKYNHNGLIDYRSLKEDPSELDALLDFLKSSEINSVSNQNKAVLINTYNLSVIANVLKDFPISSPLDKSDFFTRPVVEIGENVLSLDELEKKIIFTRYPDYRLHFALVCAAIGCPKLPNKAFRGAQIEQQLERATKESIRSKVLVKYQKSQNTLSLSELFSWYLGDFGGSEKALLKLIQKYSDASIPDNVKIDFTKYNWALNSN